MILERTGKTDLIIVAASCDSFYLLWADQMKSSSKGIFVIAHIYINSLNWIEENKADKHSAQFVAHGFHLALFPMTSLSHYIFFFVYVNIRDNFREYQLISLYIYKS